MGDQENAENNIDNEDSNESSSASSSGKSISQEDIHALKEEAKKWRLRAKQNKDAEQRVIEAEKKVKDAEDMAAKALNQVSEMKKIAEHRMIKAEIRSISSEMRLKKIEYSKLCDMSKISIDEDGNVIGVREAFLALKESDPDLFEKATTSNVSFANSQNSDKINTIHVSKMSAKEAAEAERKFLASCR